MKKIFYILASAIVALGAVACQNEVDENINPNNTKEITFNVSFDENTRIAMGELADGKLPFEFDGQSSYGGADSLYVGYLTWNEDFEREYEFVQLANSETEPNVFRKSEKYNTRPDELLREWVENGRTDIYAKTRGRDDIDSEKGANGLFFKSENFAIQEGENQVSLSLACPALYFTVPTGTEVVLSVKNESGEATLLRNMEGAISELTFGEGTHIVGINTNYFNDATVSYSIGGVVMKKKTLRNLTNKVYNLGTLGTVESKEKTVNNTEELQAALDAATDRDVIKLVAGVEYGAVYMGRPTAQNNTVMYCESENVTTTDAEEFKAIYADSKWHSTPVYTTTLKNLTIVGAEGATIAGLTTTSGHAYGDNVHDYVLGVDKNGSAYYNTLHMSNIKFENVAFNGKIDINTSDATTTYTDVIFEGCSFTTGGTASANGAAIRYYNEANNGNVKNITVANCTFNNVYQGVYVQNVNGVLVENSTFDTTGHNAIGIQGAAVNVKNVAITGNTFANIGDRVIRFNEVGADSQITITGNTSTNSGDDEGEIIKANSIAEGATLTVSDNNWNGKEVETIGGVGSSYVVKIHVPTVATVGGVEYKDLASAVAAATDGTVTLVSDVELTAPLTIASGSNTTINLNGQNLTYTNATTGESQLVNNGTMTIENGTIWYNYTGEGDASYGKGNYAIANRGTLTLGKGAVVKYSADVYKHAGYAIDNYAGATLNITEDAQVINEGNCAIRVFAGSQATNINISGGHVTGTRAIWIQLPSTDTSVAPEVNVNITGGTIEATGESGGYKLAIYSYTYGNDPKNVNINVEGGELIGDIALTGGANKTNAETVTVTGGTLTDLYSYATDEVALKTVAVKGGTFSYAPAEDNYAVYVAEGYVTAFDDEYYTVVKLSEAWKMSNTTINLPDGAYNFPGISGNNLTIKGSENAVITVTGTPAVSGNATFEGVTIKGKGVYNGVNNGESVTVTYDNVTIDGSMSLYGGNVVFNECAFKLYGDYVWTYGVANVEFNTCTFNCTNSKAILIYNEGADATNATVTNCTFNATQDGKAGAIANQNCAAIEIDNYQSSGTGVAHKLTTSGNTVGEYFSGEWRIKNYVAGNPVTVNGTEYTQLALDGKLMVKDASNNVSFVL